MSDPLLQINNLSVCFRQGAEYLDVVKNISLEIKAGESVALVGASGSGKSVSALSILQLLPYPRARHPSGEIMFKGQDVLRADPSALHQLRGGDIGMIFQEPLSALNPLHTIADQIDEAISQHQSLDKNARQKKTMALLHDVGLDFSEARLRAWPHQLSGGQRQRVMIAMAIANNPDLLIADEPTTALDVTVQAQILTLLADLRKKYNMALFLISHDLDIVRHMADRVYVMNQGNIVETGRTQDVFQNPQHSYTAQLLAAEPTGKTPTPPSVAAPPPLIEAKGLRVWFPVRAGIFRRVVDHVKAVEDVSFKLHRGHCLAVVGESGSGKTSLGLALLKLLPSQGKILFKGNDLAALSDKALRALRPSMQIVFQDPFGSLSPRMTVGDIITEGVRIHEVDPQDYRARAASALAEVGLEENVQDRYPHEFSGGQRQRIAIARALALRPSLIVLDEPTSGLDRAVQGKIIDLLRQLQKTHDLAFLFISHDLKVVRMLAHEVIVMKEGCVVEQGAADDIFLNPQKAYTKTLMQAAFEKASKAV